MMRVPAIVTRWGVEWHIGVLERMEGTTRARAHRALDAGQQDAGEAYVEAMLAMRRARMRLAAGCLADEGRR